MTAFLIFAIKDDRKNEYRREAWAKALSKRGKIQKCRRGCLLLSFAVGATAEATPAFGFAFDEERKSNALAQAAAVV